MVKFDNIKLYYIAILLIFSLLSSLNSLAAKFEASVDAKDIAISEGLTLSLTLFDAKPKSNPSDGVLKKDFTVQGKAHSSSTKIINGNVSSQIGWRYSLNPKHKGEIEIPAISIETDNGQLSTKPIKIKVSTSSAIKDSAYEQGVSVTGTISKKDPHTNETIIYTAQVISYHDVSNLHSSNFEINDVICEQIDTPVIEKKVIDGYSALTITYKYRLTPLKSGKIEIPSQIMNGIVIDKSSGSRWGALYRDDVDQFDIFGNVDRFNNLSSHKNHKFKISTKPITLNVQEVPQEHSALIRAENLQIIESFDEKQQLKQGEPLTRSLTIRSIGTMGNQLPNLENEVNAGEEGIKIYPDLPRINDHIKDDKQIGERVESYTLIPQKAGKIILPKISIAWWNVKTKQVQYTTIDKKVLNIAQGTADTQVNNNQFVNTNNTSKNNIQKENAPHNNARYRYIIWGILSVISCVIIIAFIVSLRKTKKQQILESTNDNTKNQQSNILYKDALKTQSTKELRDFLQRYANHHFGLSKHVPLEDIFQSIEAKLPVNMIDETSQVIKNIQGNLYAQQAIDLESTKKQCANILKIATKIHRNVKYSKKRKDEELPKLNP